MHSFHSVTYLILFRVIFICLIVIQESHFISENCSWLLRNRLGQPVTKSQPPSRWPLSVAIKKQGQKKPYTIKRVLSISGIPPDYQASTSYLVLPPLGWWYSTAPTRCPQYRVRCRLGPDPRSRGDMCAVSHRCHFLLAHLRFHGNKSVKDEGREMNRWALHYWNPSGNLTGIMASKGSFVFITLLKQKFQWPVLSLQIII